MADRCRRTAETDRLPPRRRLGVGVKPGKTATLFADSDSFCGDKPLKTFPSALDFQQAATRRNRVLLFGSLLLSLACGAGFVAVGSGTPVVPIVLLLCLGGGLLLWHKPRASLYIAFVAACMLELMPVKYADSITERIPFFWNINTIFQVFLHVDFKAVPLNLLEVIFILAAIASLIRAVALRQVSVRLGPLFVPIFIYICFVVMAWVNGMATGGDFKLSLQEVRAQFYFIFAYLMAVNIIRTPQQATRLMWTAALCIGIKGILYTFRRYVTLAGLPLPDQGVGSHEEAFFFNVFVMLLVTLVLCGQQGHLRRWMWILLPIVMTGNLATNRRAATAAMVIAVPVLLLVAYRVLPDRRRLVGWFGALMVIGFSIYYPLFKNSDSMFAQPARAIQSQFQPDARDASSNIYRDAENTDLMATIRLAPVQGYGYGKRMLHAVPIADISLEYEWWDLLTHNQVLWVWMRTGTFGFFAFWMMISSILMFICRTLCLPQVTAEAKAVGIFTILTLSMLMVFGLLDLQFSNYRDMLFTGFWVGIAAGLPGWKKAENSQESAVPISSAPKFQRLLPPPPIHKETEWQTEALAEPETDTPTVGRSGNSGLAARNFLASLATQLLSWGLTFAVTLFLPRYAGVAGMGKLTFAASFAAVLVVLAPLGTSSVIVKEIARNRARAGELLSATLAMRIPLAIALAGITYGALCLMNLPASTRLLVLVGLLGMIIVTINDALGATLQGLENLTRQGIGVLTDKFLLGILTIVFIFLKQPLWAIAAAAIVTAIVSCTVNLYSLRSILPDVLRKPEGALIRNLVTGGVAFIGLSIFTTLYGQCDLIVLNAMTNDQTVGWYATAARLIGTTLFLPTAVNAALLPTLARLHSADKTQFPALARKIMTLIAVCGVPVALILLIAPDRLIGLLHYPTEFAGSIPVLRVGGATALLYYLTIGAGAIIVAADRQRQMLWIFGMSCLIGIPACIVFTYLGHRFWHNGALGAIWSDTLMEFCILVGLMRSLAGIITIREMLTLLLRLFAAAAPLSFLLWAGGLWTIVPGLILYAGGCLLLRCIDAGEILGLLRGGIRGRTLRETPMAASAS